MGGQENISQAPLRWAKSGISAIEPRQRIIIPTAGGAMHPEGRACYEVSKAYIWDVILGSLYMLKLLRCCGWSSCKNREPRSAR